MEMTTQTAATAGHEVNDHERKTYIRIMGIVSAIAQSAAHSPEQVSLSHPERDDIHGFKVEHPVTPVEVYAKRGVTEDGWGYEWTRIHVHIAGNSIGTNRIMDIKRDHGLEVVDVWQLRRDEDADMGAHDRPCIRFALESRQ